MPFWKGAGRRRRDAIEPDVVNALKAYGVEVLYLNGRNLPDLLCHFRSRWIPLGVKSGEKARLTKGEREGKATWPIIRTVGEAVRVVVG